MAVKAPSMSPAVPDRRFGAAVPGPRRVLAIISGPTGGRRCLRYGALLKRGFGVRSSWSRSGSFNGLPRPGVARELPFKSHFKGEAKCGRCCMRACCVVTEHLADRRKSPVWSTEAIYLLVIVQPVCRVPEERSAALICAGAPV
jgi:hypothetical protein